VQLSEVLELAAREGVRRHLEKRAGVMLPLAVGAMIPGIVHKAVQRAHATEQQLNHDPTPPYKMAALPLPLALPLAQMWQSMGKNVGGPLKNMGANLATGKTVADAGGAAANFASKGLGQIASAPAGGIASGLSKLVERKMFGQEFGQRQDALSLGGRKALDSFSSEAGKAGFGLLRDIANKAMEAAGHAGDQAARDAIIGDLKRNDPVLAGADDATLMEAYHTMSRFAPVLSTDKNAVRSFLRQAVTSGSGPDFMSIKLVADAERAVTGEKKAVDLHALLQAAAKPALAGAAVGGISGAMADKDDRGGGALRGALTGGALGGLGGALHGHLNTPDASDGRFQGATPSVAPNKRRIDGVTESFPTFSGVRPDPHVATGAAGLPYVSMEHFPSNESTLKRSVPRGVAPVLDELMSHHPGDRVQ